MQKGFTIFLGATLFFLAGCSWMGIKNGQDCPCCSGACRPGAFHKADQVGLRIVNVLDKELFDDAHIAGAPGVESICVAFDDVTTVAAYWDKDIPVVVYCSNYFCGASREVASMLIDLGFKKVYAYEGGIAEWYQLFNETHPELIAGPAKQEYLTVVVSAPVESDLEEKVGVITAQELQNLIKEATISE